MGYFMSYVCNARWVGGQYSGKNAHVNYPYEKRRNHQHNPQKFKLKIFCPFALLKEAKYTEV